MNNFGAARYDKINRIIFEEYKGIVNVKAALDILRKCMAFSEKHKVLGTFSDLSEVKGTYTMLNKFFEEEYMPVMISRGLKYSGIVVSNDIFTQYATTDIIQRLGTFEIQTFGSVDTGKAWINKKCAQFPTIPSVL